MRTFATAPRSSVRGFSLLELMFAMTIGLVLSLAVGQIFLGSRAGFTSNDNLSRVQENARYALGLLSREIRLSTYRSDPRVARATLYPLATAPSLTGADGGTGGVPVSGLSDTITVRFQGSGTGTGTADGTVQDCVGNRIDTGAAVVNTLLIQNDAANNNEPTLFCNTVTTACVAATCFALVPGVENMQVLYGEDINSGAASPNPDGSIDRWVTAANVTNWDNVLSVRISLLLRTDDRVGTTVDAKSYSMSGTNVYAPGNDTRLRRVFTTVINLRNRTS